MGLPIKDQKEILKSLGALTDDTRQAVFYYHEVFDNDASTSSAKDLAVIEAREKTLRYNRNREPQDHKIFDPDFHPDNLIKLGAKSVYKQVLYVKINQRGSKDWKSRIATEEDKITFKQAWEHFYEEEKSKQENDFIAKQQAKRAEEDNQQREHREIERKSQQETENAFRDSNVRKGWEAVQLNPTRPEYPNTQTSGIGEFNYTIEVS